MTRPAVLISGSRTSPGDFVSAAIADIVTGIGMWRIWSMLALNDVKQRYRRSRLGQFWLTLSMALTIVALAFVYAAIFQIPLETYLPLIAASLIVWGLIAGICNEGATVFIEAEAYIRSVPLPKSVFVFRMLLRNLIIFAHNLVIAPIVMLIFWVVPNWNLLYLVPAVALTLCAGAFVGLILGTLSARFRDMPPIIASFTQIAFFLSPIMWSASQLRGQFKLLTDWNPFAAFLTIMRDPILGLPPSGTAWLFAAGFTLAAFAVSLVFFGRFRARISYYL